MACACNQVERAFRAARDTVGNVGQSGFVDVGARPVFPDIVQHIDARKPARES